jgi:hypothetical protein
MFEASRFKMFKAELGLSTLLNSEGS